MTTIIITRSTLPEFLDWAGRQAKAGRLSYLSLTWNESEIRARVEVVDIGPADPLPGDLFEDSPTDPDIGFRVENDE